MNRLASTVVLALAGLSLASGCVSSPWLSQSEAVHRNSSTLGDNAAALPLTDRSDDADRSTAEISSGHDGSDLDRSDRDRSDRDREMHEMVAELKKLGTLDAEAQKSLLEDLNNIQPSIWPAYLAQMRAAMAYQQRAKEQRMSEQPPAPNASQGLAGESPAASATFAAGQPPTHRSPTHQPMLENGTAWETALREMTLGKTARRELAAFGIHSAKPPLPATSHTSISDPERALRRTVARPPQAKNDVEATRIGHDPTARRAVVAASYTQPTPYTPDNSHAWQRHVAEAAYVLESRLARRESTEIDDEADTEDQARLRLLYLLAGRREDAFRPIRSAAPALSEFWSNELYGLDTFLDTQAIADPADRTVRAKEAFDEANSRLGAAAPSLAVHSVAFCSDIDSFGRTTRFDTYDFQPNQEVLVYAEVDNFTTRPTTDGFHTSLAISYRIFDNEQRPVAQHDFPPAEDHCQSPRQDFFVSCRFRMPERIYNGEHTLKLALEDLNGNKFGESSIRFRIVEPKKR